MSPGLTSHQQLDAGIAARQQAGRKSLRKSKRPFDTYFRTQFRFSPRVRLPVTQTTGVMSSYDAVKMMTDPKRSWSTPWDRGGSGGGRTRRKRQDVLEPTATAFGDDDVDRLVERLIEIRFSWDREDDVLCTSLVPDTLYRTTAHCRPYMTEVAPSPLTSSTALTSKGISAASDEGVEDGEEVVMIAGAAVRIRRRTPVVRQKSGQPKRPHAHSSLGFSGVDTVPTLVLDVSHGPFVTAPSAPLMTLRWKGEHRSAASAQSSLQLLRRVREVPVVGLAPRTSFLLLKALATVEVEEPALAVSLAIAVGENYNAFTDAECLEALRCLRRLAFVRGLPELATPDINAIAVASMSGAAGGGEGDGSASLPQLYTDATLTSSMLSQYLSDAAPFLIGKVWARLPEQSRHLLQRGFFLDWFDLVRLAIAASGPHGLPERLPNATTEAPYAAKHFFFHHTLGLKADVLAAMVAALRGAAIPAASSPLAPPHTSTCADHHHLHRHTMPDGVAQDGTDDGARKSTSVSVTGAPPHFVDDVKEEVDKPLILWLCASLLVRIVAEALGDVVRHVGDLLHQHAALAAERADAHDADAIHDGGAERSGALSLSPLDVDEIDSKGEATSHEVCRPYPRFSSGAYQQMGCRRPKQVRVRLLPFEAFPRVAQCFSCPYASVTEKVEARERQRRARASAARRKSHGSHRGKERHVEHAISSLSSLATSEGALSTHSPVAEAKAGRRVMQSTFAAVLAESPRMVRQIERTCAALRWSTNVLQSCCALVRDLPASAPPPVSVTPARRSTGGPTAARALRDAASATAATAAAVKRQAREEDDEWARETVAMEVRHALCYRHVRSAVQTHMDALFTFLPWAELEAQWEPMLTTGDEAESEGAETESTAAAAEGGCDDSFSAEALVALLAEDDLGGADKKSEEATAGSAPLSETEQRARAMMEELRECLEEFQVAVADVLEAHERFFGASHADSSSGATR